MFFIGAIMANKTVERKSKIALRLNGLIIFVSIEISTFDDKKVLLMV